MHHEKMISIVLPVYNGATHLAYSIESVINQVYQNWELIIVNDCSTDDSLAIAESYQKKDSRIRVISNEKNLKLPLTLNAGFSQAKGEYFTWTSDDNMYKPEALRRLAQELDQDADCVMVYSDCTIIDSDGKEIGPAPCMEPEQIVVGNVFGACFLYRAEVARKVGLYDANLFLAEDYDYWMRIYRNGKIKYVKESLYLYRHHDGSLTTTKKALVNMQTYYTLEKNFLPLYADAKNRGLEFALFDQMMYRVSDDQKEATMELLCAVNGKYTMYLQQKEIMARLRAGIIGKVWRAMKGIIRKVWRAMKGIMKR